MADIDAILRESLNRLAKPGDPKGVAEAIRARLDAGGSGSSTGSGSGSSGRGTGGGGLGGKALLVPLASLALVAAVVGGAAGFSGVTGRPQTQGRGVSASVAGGVHAFGCPGGAAVEELRPGTRVLAVQRNDNGSWLGIRDPYALTRTVWLPARAIVVDDGQPSVATLAVGGCPAPALEPFASPTEVAATPAEATATATATAAPTPEPTLAPTPTAAKPTPKPTLKPTPKPVVTASPTPPDKVPPSISAGSWSVSPVFGDTWNCGPSNSKITVTATDNVGVLGVTAATTFPGATVTLQSHSGSSYDFVFQMPVVNPATGTTSVTFTARDAAGNTRAITVSLAVNYCLI